MKEDTHERYQTHMDLYNFLLRKTGENTEDYAFLLFYYLESVTETRGVIFDTKLIKIQTNLKEGEKVFQKAIQIVKEDIPKVSEECEFCKWLGI